MKTIIIPLIIALIVVLTFLLRTGKEPRIGQVYVRTIETTYGRANHIDTILILRVEEYHVVYTELHKYDEWMCPISSIKQYGRLLK